MSKYICRSVPLVLFLVTALAVTAAPTKLELKFTKGETCEQVVRIESKGTVGPEGQQMPLNMTMTMRMASEVLDVKPDGMVMMKTVFKEFKISGMLGMPEMDVGQMFGLNDKVINLTLDRKGKVVEMEGMDELAGGGMPGGMSSDPGQFDFPYFPDEPVDIGGTWQDEGETGLPGSPVKGKRSRNYVLRDIKEADGMTVAVIGVKEKTAIEDATMTTKAPMGGNVEITQHINSMTIEQEGEMLLDIAKGCVLGAQVLMKLNQDVSISTGVQGQEFPGSIKTQMDMDTTVVYNYGDKKTPDLSGLYTKRETPAEETGSTEK